MTDEQAPDRRTRVAGALAAVVAGVVVVVAALAARDAAPRTADDPTARPTVASATATATPGDAATATPGSGDGTPAEAGGSGGSATATALPRDVQEVVDVVRELESGTPVAAPVGVGDGVEVAPGVRVAVDRVQRVDGQAVGPGESSGPALALDVRITNDSGTTVTADGLVVNVYGTDGVPGSQLLGDPRSAPLQGDIAGGTSVQGVYVLTGPGGSTAGPHVVSVALGAGSTTALVVLPSEAG